MTTMVRMNRASALHVARAPRKASDVELSLAYDELEALCDDLESTDEDDAPFLLDTLKMARKGMAAIDLETYRREAYLPEFSRAGMREAV